MGFTLGQMLEADLEKGEARKADKWRHSHNILRVLYNNLVIFSRLGAAPQIQAVQMFILVEDIQNTKTKRRFFPFLIKKWSHNCRNSHTFCSQLLILI